MRPNRSSSAARILVALALLAGAAVPLAAQQEPLKIGVVDLEETGRLLAWFGETVPEDEIAIGMPLQVVPRIFEEVEDIRVYYTVERPGATWGKAPRAS